MPVYEFSRCEAIMGTYCVINCRNGLFMLQSQAYSEEAFELKRRGERSGIKTVAPTRNSALCVIGSESHPDVWVALVTSARSPSKGKVGQERLCSLSRFSWVKDHFEMTQLSSQPEILVGILLILHQDKS